MEYKFEKLTPNPNTKLDIYEDAIDFVFKNDDLTNIGISGPYSSGKSSVLESYKNLHCEKRFIHISLAEYDKKPQSNSTVNDDIRIENNIQGKIINQLIYQIPIKRIPDTNFMLTHKDNKKELGFQTGIIMIFLTLTVYIFGFYKWSQFVNSITFERIYKILRWTTYAEFRLLAGIFWVMVLGMCIYKVACLQNTHHLFKKFNINGNEIEMFGMEQDSYFDRYLNEIIYLFDHSDADVIVFEDIDRYEDNSIFKHLREINILINRERRADQKTE